MNIEDLEALENTLRSAVSARLSERGESLDLERVLAEIDGVQGVDPIPDHLDHAEKIELRIARLQAKLEELLTKPTRQELFDASNQRIKEYLADANGDPISPTVADYLLKMMGTKEEDNGQDL